MAEDSTLLLVSLEVAVPMWIERHRGTPEADRMERARELAQIVGEKGDVILYRGKPGESAAAFNALAEGMALAAYANGGVTFAGAHWSANG